MIFDAKLYDEKILKQAIKTYNAENKKKIKLLQDKSWYLITWDKDDFMEISNIYIFLFNENFQ